MRYEICSDYHGRPPSTELMQADRLQLVLRHPNGCRIQLPVHLAAVAPGGALFMGHTTDTGQAVTVTYNGRWWLHLGNQSATWLRPRNPVV